MKLPCHSLDDDAAFLRPVLRVGTAHTDASASPRA